MPTDFKEVEVDGFAYQIGQLNAFDQLHVFKRLLPMLAGLNVEGDGDLAAKAAKGFEAMAANLQKLSDQDCDYIVNTCLTAVRRKVGNTWAPVMTRDKQLMYQDIKLTVMLNLTGQVIQENLSDFFNTAGATSGAPKAAPAQN